MSDCGGVVGGASWALIALVLVVFAQRLLERRRIREAILDVFGDAAAAAVESSVPVREVAVEALWVALRLCGHATHLRLRDLSAPARADVELAMERVCLEAEHMLGEDLLAPVQVRFDRQAKDQVFQPPRTLWRLGGKGREVVLARLARRRLAAARGGRGGST